MAKDPAVLFYTSDFLMGTSFFTDAQCGQYIRLLCQQHQLDLIPEGHMTTICGSLDSPVVQKFIRTKDGFYYNERMKEEKEKRIKYCNSRNNNKKGENQHTKKGGHMTTHMTTHMTGHTGGHMENENDNENISINDVLIYLNNKAKKKFNITLKANRKFVSARLKDGASVDDMKRVIDFKVSQWANDEKMSTYLRPETLFNSTKFESYLQDAGSKQKVVTIRTASGREFDVKV